MDWHQTALLASPLITTTIAFFLNKYFQNKPKLLTYFGHISTHKMPFTNGYNIFSLAVNNKPNKAMMDRKFRNNLPAIIKHAKEIWIYGLDDKGNTQLKQSEDAKIYERVEFKDEMIPAGKVSAEIYDDISSIGAHFEKVYINTHSVVVRNSGRLPAHNVRIGHKFLPDYQVMPDSEYKEVKMQGSGIEIIFPTLVPDEQVTITYMYFAPTMYTDVNTYVKSDEGLAKFVNVIPTIILKAWQKAVFYILLFIGCSTVIYLTILAIVAIHRCVSSVGL